MRYGFIALTTVLVAASTSFGAAWTPPAGSTSNFSYTDGQDTNGRFGNATADASGFSFSPTTFTSTSSGLSATNASDTASVDVTAAAGRTITSISASILGDYTILGTGAVDSVGTLTITNLDTLAVFTQPLIFSGTPAATVTSTQGVFSGATTITLPAGTTHARLQLSDTLTSGGNAGSSTLIQIKDADLGIITAVPEPTSALAVAGLAMLLRRSRR